MKTNFKKDIFTILFWIVVFVISTYFFFNSISDYLLGKLEARRASEKWWLVVHFTGAACTLFLGPLQFWAPFRNRFRNWHRIAGKFYIGGSIIAAIMVFYLLSNYPLPGAIPSLGLLAIIWLFTTIVAFWFAVKKNFKQHKQFMIRSYVCGLAFVFIRLFSTTDKYTGVFGFMENKEVRFTVYEWLCWVYPLMITEFLLVWYPLLSKQKESDAKPGANMGIAASWARRWSNRLRFAMQQRFRLDE
ncbi:hypothetical protein GCM10023187_54890 [Nibrella viscosa]|uniref:DUF2306 domain-containing protein n=1 Tax=Nibrella viscosa TaxID=1084524 RepID=A0ABP8L0Z5_9BACT